MTDAELIEFLGIEDLPADVTSRYLTAMTPSRRARWERIALKFKSIDSLLPYTSSSPGHSKGEE